MLDEESKNTFMRPQGSTVDTKRHFFVAFVVRVLQVEAGWLSNVHLVRGQRKFLANHAPYLHIDLWPIECGFILCLNERYVAIYHGAAYHVFRFEPQAFVIHILLAESCLAMQRQAHHIFLDSKQFKVFEI